MDKIKETCDNCEHDNDSSQEYCGSCDGHTSNWVKGRWILQGTIDILQAENKKLKEQQLTVDTIEKVFDKHTIIANSDILYRKDLAIHIIKAREAKNG